MVTERTLAVGVVLWFSLLLGGCGAPSISIVVSPPVSYLRAGQTTQFKASVSSETGLIWQVNDVSGGDSTVGIIDAQGNYTAPSNLSGVFTVKALSVRSAFSYGSAQAILIARGHVTTTNNPLVAAYSISSAMPAKVSVEFGADTNYGFATWTQDTPADGSPAKLLVAGMHPSTPYHMRAVLHFDGGEELVDSDHVFTTGGIPNGLQFPQIAVSRPSGLPPRN
jgi:hypothetical protein